MKVKVYLLALLALVLVLLPLTASAKDTQERCDDQVRDTTLIEGDYGEIGEARVFAPETTTTQIRVSVQ